MKSLIRYTLILSLALGLFPLSSLPDTLAQSGFTPIFEEAPCAVDVPDEYVEGETFLCGFVNVPELHAQPDGPTIRLAVVVIKSDSSMPALDPLVMFTGGPGGDIFAMIGAMAGDFGAPIRAKHDIVLFSERGTIGSEPLLTCPELAVIEDHFGVPEEDVFALQKQAFQDCYARLTGEGINLNVYNNLERAADVPLVMQALGYDQYNLWGVSGGGMLVQLVARDFPDGVWAIMTDSGSFPNPHMLNVLPELAYTTDSSFRRLFAECAADAACNAAYPDLQTTFFAVVDQLNAEPVQVLISQPDTGVQAEISLTGDLLIRTMTNQFSQVAQFPKVIYQMAGGDFSAVAGWLPGLYAVDDDFADGMYRSLFCAEVRDFTLENLDVEGVDPHFVTSMGAVVQIALDQCAIWDVKSVPMPDVLVSDIPILIMEGAYDTNKRPDYGEVVARNFTTSHLAVFGGTAHVTLSPCAIQLMAQFMDDPQQTPDMTCVPTGVEFVLPGGEQTLSPVTIPELGISTVVPQGWTNSAPGVYVRAGSPNDPTALLFLTFPGEDAAAGVSTLAASEGYTEPVQISELPGGNDLTWTIYTAQQQDVTALIAAVVHGSSLYVVVLQSPTLEIQTLSDQAGIPALLAFQFLD